MRGADVMDADGAEAAGSARNSRGASAPLTTSAATTRADGEAGAGGAFRLAR